MAPSTNNIGGILGGEWLDNVKDASSAAFQSITREVTYQANRGNPNVIPATGDVIKLLNCGLLSESDARLMLAYNGVRMSRTAGSQSATSRAWDSLIDATARTFEPQTLLQWYRAGYITEGDFDGHMKRNGYGFDVTRNWLKYAPTYYQASEVVSLYVAKVIDYDRAIAELERIGYKRADADSLLSATARPPGVAEILSLLSRGALTDDLANAMLFRNGITSDIDLKAIKTLRQPIPPPSDLIMFGVREVWDEATVLRYGYDSELPPQFRTFMASSGMDLPLYPPGDDSPHPAGLTFTDAYWRAHWQLVSPEQAYRMFHLLRGNPADPRTWRFPGVRPFTADDLNRVLKISDYPPALRDSLAAIAYTPMRIADIRNSIKYLRKDKAWAYEAFLDRGLKPVDANTAADLAVVMANSADAYAVDSVTKAAKKGFLVHLLDQYNLGIIDRNTAFGLLTSFGLKADDANMALDIEDAKIREDIVKSAMKQARSDWFMGRTSLQGIANRLAGINIQQDRITQFIAKLTVERGESRVVLSTSRVLAMYKNGMLDRDSTIQRLQNLNWNDVDTILQVADIERQIAQTQAHQAEVEQAALSKNAAALQKLQKQQQANMEHTQAQLRTITPIKTVMGWYVDGKVNSSYVQGRLAAMGVDAADIGVYIADADATIQNNKEKASAGTKKAP